MVFPQRWKPTHQHQHHLHTSPRSLSVLLSSPPPCSYYFLTEVYPLASGRHLIRTPMWLSRLCLQYGIGRVPIAVVNPLNPSDVRFRAFQGRGRRLAD